mmetsp:Transcript_32049/g.76477  ORF Transcript_32049/g.76477 Transcript_32049/m.76477 type:complete len:297 (+) Transcript_32049:1885-2775(+)
MYLAATPANTAPTITPGTAMMKQLQKQRFTMLMFMFMASEKMSGGRKANMNKCGSMSCHRSKDSSKVWGRIPRVWAWLLWPRKHAMRIPSMKMVQVYGIPRPARSKKPMVNTPITTVTNKKRMARWPWVASWPLERVSTSGFLLAALPLYQTVRWEMMISSICCSSVVWLATSASLAALVCSLLCQLSGTEWFVIASASFITKSEISSSSLWEWELIASACTFCSCALSLTLVWTISCNAVLSALLMLWQAQSLDIPGRGKPAQVLMPLSPKKHVLLQPVFSGQQSSLRQISGWFS